MSSHNQYNFKNAEGNVLRKDNCVDNGHFWKLYNSIYLEPATHRLVNKCTRQPCLEQFVPDCNVGSEEKENWVYILPSSYFV